MNPKEIFDIGKRLDFNDIETYDVIKKLHPAGTRT
jgi:hypothetical protein